MTIFRCNFAVAVAVGLLLTGCDIQSPTTNDTIQDSDLNGRLDDLQKRVEDLEAESRRNVEAETLREVVSDNAQLVGLPGGERQDFSSLKKCLAAKQAIEEQRARPGYVAPPLACIEL